MSEENKPSLTDTIIDRVDENRKSGFKMQKLIAVVFLFAGLIYAGIFFEGITSITIFAVITIAIIAAQKFMEIPVVIFISILIFLSPVAAGFDLRGNFIYNRPVQMILCQADEKLETEVIETRKRGRIGYNFGFICSKNGEKGEYISNWAVYGIRLVEYILIGWCILLAFLIYQKLTGQREKIFRVDKAVKERILREVAAEEARKNL